MELTTGYFDSEPESIQVINKELKQLLTTNTPIEDIKTTLLSQSKSKQEILGQFHTPECFQEIVFNSLPDDLIEQVSEGKKIIDPSCGTGNFLIGVIDRALAYFKDIPSLTNEYEAVNNFIIPNLFGSEIDDLMIEATKLSISQKYLNKIKIPKIFHRDMLSDDTSIEFSDSFQFVIGNPPWVEVKKLPTTKKNFIQKKYKTNNLYSAFLLESLNLVNEGGYVCFVLPRSFTGGAYFSSLRETLRKNCSIRQVSYIQNRKQKFQGGRVLQEIVIPCITKGKSIEKVKCTPLSNVGEPLESFSISQDKIYTDHDNILLLANSLSELLWVNKIMSLKNFEESGFQFSTGQLVPHRAKDLLRTSKDDKAYPIIYAHNISLNKDSQSTLASVGEVIKGRPPFAVQEGYKNFDGRNKEKDPELCSIAKWLSSHKEIILMRRRSHKGDKRRFTGVYCSNQLPEKYFLENSTNYIIKKRNVKDAISLNIFFKVLSSSVFERFFAVISSNTQINKNDMFLFGLPSTYGKEGIIKELEKTKSTNQERINSLAEALYEF